MDLFSEIVQLTKEKHNSVKHEYTARDFLIFILVIKLIKR